MILKILSKTVKNFNRFIFTTIVKFTCPNIGGRINVNFYSVIKDNVILGDNINFNGMHISRGGRVTIGNNFHSGKNCMIIVQNHNFEGVKIPYDHTYINKSLTIGDNVWIGHNVTILGGLEIGEGAIIQAGAVVVNDIPPCGIAGGNPAKVFKYRDKDHYQSLKEAGQFH